MDPRHPELAVARLKELLKQYDRIEDDMKTATVTSKLGQLEREGGLVVQEICLVAPRIHEAMMQTSRQRRHDLSRGFFPEVNANNLKKPTKEAIESYVEKPVEKPVHIEKLVETELDKEVDEILKPLEEPKKKTTKKKTTKKKKAE